MQEGQDKTAVSGGVVTITPSGFISQVDQTHTHTHTHTHTGEKRKSCKFSSSRNNADRILKFFNHSVINPEIRNRKAVTNTRNVRHY